jgi:hypothetical protein
MNLKIVTNQLNLLKSNLWRVVSNFLKIVWDFLNYDLNERFFFPQKRILVALDKDSLSFVYGSSFFGRSRIFACRKYTYERKSLENISRKYVYQDGQIPKPEVVASVLTHFISESNARSVKVILSLPKAWTIHRTVEFPVTILESLEEVISYELDRLLCLNSENAYIDYRVVRKNSETVNIAVAAAKKDIIDGYIKAIEDIGMKVEKVTSNLSVAGVFLNHCYGRHTFLVVEIFQDAYEVSAIENGIILFAYQEKFNTNDQEKRVECLLEDLRTHAKSFEQKGQSLQIVLFIEQTGYESLREKVDGIPLHILRKTNLSIELKGKTQEADFLSLSAYLQLLKPDFESRNFLSKKRKDGFLQSYGFTIILAFTSIILVFATLFSPIMYEAVRIYQLEKRIHLLKDDFRKFGPQKYELDEILYQIQTINEFKNTKPPRILLLREISDLIPEKFWISRMTITENTFEFEMHGKGAQGDVVPILEASPYFKNVRLVTRHAATGENPQTMSSNVFLMDIDNTLPANEKGQ